MSASGRKRAVHGSHEETTVPGEGNESDLPATILDGCVECDHQESIQGERRVGWDFLTQGFHQSTTSD